MEYTFTDRRWLTEEDLEIDLLNQVGTQHASHPVSEATDLYTLVSRNGLGLHVAGAFAHVTDIQTCHLQPEPANAIRNFVRDFAVKQGINFQNVKYHKGFLRNLVLRNNTSGQFMVTLVIGEDDRENRERLFEALIREFDCISSLWYCINTKLNDSTFDLDFIHVAGDLFLLMQLGHIECKLGPKSFFQTNSLQAGTMCSLVQQMAGLTGKELVYDLYSGIGSFALYLAKDARHVVGIEEVPEAIADARINAAHNDIGNVLFYSGDVKKLIVQADLHRYGTPDVIVTDPPRSGMDLSVVKSLIELHAPTIIYVSCNPATQARDIDMLSTHYRVIQSQPVDMFPQTAHVENVALLEHK
jgi:23S rRNA (uracil1939-C5)-methyltransferase